MPRPASEASAVLPLRATPVPTSAIPTTPDFAASAASVIAAAAQAASDLHAVAAQRDTALAQLAAATSATPPPTPIIPPPTPTPPPIPVPVPNPAQKHVSEHGTQWINVRDHGAVPDGVTDSASAFQAAFDAAVALASVSGTGRATLFVPSGPRPYVFSRPVFLDGNNVAIVGEPGSSVQMVASATTFYAGVTRFTPSTANRPTLSGVLDATAAKAGALAGYRTLGTSWLQYEACPLTCGVKASGGTSQSDNWTETSQVTVDVCVAPGTGTTFPLNAPILGLGCVDPPEASPWLIRTTEVPNQLAVWFRCNDQFPGATTLDAPMIRAAFFTIPSVLWPPYRISVQIDLKAATVTAFVNGTQVAVTPPTGPWPKGLAFATNDHFSFLVGAGGPQGNNSGTLPDLVLFGLKVSNAVRYADAGPGKPQTRLDSAAITDASRYFTDDASTVAYLPFSDPLNAGMLASVNGGATYGGRTPGLIVANPATTNDGLSLQGLQLWGATYGRGISAGGVMNFRVENLEVSGYVQAIGSSRTGLVYPFEILGCRLSGSDAVVDLYNATAYLDRITVGMAGRVPFRVHNSNIVLRNLFIAGSYPVVECAVLKSRAGNIGACVIRVDGGIVDFEGRTVSRAGFLVEANGECPGTVFEICGFVLGTLGAPAIELVDTHPANDAVRPCELIVQGLRVWDAVETILVHGPLWNGTIRTVGLSNPAVKNSGRWGTATNVTFAP